MKVYSFLQKSLHIISLIAVGIIFSLNFIYTSSVSYDSAEKVSIDYHIIKSILLLLLATAIIFAVSFFKKYLERIKEKYLFLVFCVIYILMGVYLLCNVDHSLRADALSVSNAAKELLAGTGSMLDKGGYIYKYPHQVGLMLYDWLLYKVAENNLILFTANLGLVLGVNFLVYKISDLIFKDRLTNNIAIILSFAFLPQFFFIMFAYGTVPGFFFMIFAFYHALAFSKNQRYINLIFTVAGSLTAVCLRKNFLIGVIAITIFLFLNLFKKFSVKYLILIACMFISLVLPLKILPAAFVGDTAGMPSVLWVAMGTDIDNTVRGEGWYDATNSKIFSSADFNSNISKEAGAEKLKNNIQKIKERPIDACKFFVRKTISQWCNPLCQSLWSGPLEDCNQHTDTPLLKSLYDGGNAEKYLSYAIKTYTIVFWGLCLMFLIKYGKNYGGWELLCLMLLGGFIFHLFWEGKSQYIYPYFFALIPIAAFPLSRIVTKLNLLTSGIKKQV